MADPKGFGPLLAPHTAPWYNILAASAGCYHSPGWNRNYPRRQMVTVAELLEGKGIDMPPVRQVSTTSKKAPKVKGDADRQMSMEMS